MSAKKKDFGQASEFLSEAQLLHFRGLTNLLRATNGIDDHTQAGGFGMIHVHEKSNKHHELYRRLAEFDDLLVRHMEVIAIRAADEHGKLVQILEGQPDEPEEGDGHVEEEEPEMGRVYYTANPDPDTDKASGNKRKGMDKKISPLLVDLLPTSNESATSAGAWLLGHTTGVKRKAPKTDITLDRHGSMLISLIYDTHKALDKPALKVAQKTLQNYVMLASIAKIRGRLIRGEELHQRNLWSFLTKSAKQLKDNAINEYDIEIIPASADGMPIPRGFLNRVLLSLEAAKIEVTPELEMFRDSEMRYKKDTRPVFQTLLSSLLGVVGQAIKKLADVKQKLLLKRGKEGMTKDEESSAAEELDYYADIAGQWLRLLAALLDHAKPIMQAHLTYLKRVFDIQGVKKIEKGQTSDSLAIPPNTTEHIPENPSSDMYSSSSAESSHGDMEGLAHAFAKTAVGKSTSYGADFEEIDSSALQRDWDLAALKFLNLICLHQRAMNSLQRGHLEKTVHDRKTFNFLNSATFEYVRCHQEQADKNMTSMKEVIENIKLPNGKNVDPADITRIKDYIQEHEQHNGKPIISDEKWADEKNFEGNFHCETLMVSLQLLAQKQGSKESRPVQGDTSPYLQLPSQEVLDRFKHPAKVLPVSKRCCPACHALLKYVLEKEKEDILYPGYHENWFAAALPPWIPREAGEAVIEVAEHSLVNRIEMYLRRGTPSSDSSTGTSPVHTSREDEFPSFPEDEPIPPISGWDSQRGEKRKRP